MNKALQLIAASRGVPKTGETIKCHVCGESPFAEAKTVKKMFGPSFSDWDLLIGGSDIVCAGCVSVLGGRPSKTDPPVRMLQIVAIQGEPMKVVKRAQFEDYLRSPPSVPFVIVWNDSMKKHGALRAGVSGVDEFVIGTDSGTVYFRPADDMPLLDACKELRGSFARKHILGGAYPPKKINEFGMYRWSQLEDIVEKYRPSYLLDFIIGTISAPEVDDTNIEEEEMAISPEIELAADIVEPLASSSRRDVKWGVYYDGFALRRVNAVKSGSESLVDFVEKFSEKMASSTPKTAEAVAVVRMLPLEDETEVLKAIKKNASVIVAIAYQRKKDRKENK